MKITIRSIFLSFIIAAPAAVTAQCAQASLPSTLLSSCKQGVTNITHGTGRLWNNGGSFDGFIGELETLMRNNPEVTLLLTTYGTYATLRKLYSIYRAYRKGRKIEELNDAAEGA